MMSLTKKTQIEKLAELSFIVLLFTEMAFQRTLASRLGMIFFTISFLLLIFEKRKIHFHYYFVLSFFFILYNFLHVQVGISIDSASSLDMMNTLVLNFGTLFMTYNYFTLRKNELNILMLTKNITLFIGLLFLILELSTGFSGRLGGSFYVIGTEISINPNSLATYSGVSFVIVLYKYFKKQNHSYTTIQLIFLSMIVLLTGSRKGIILILIGSSLLIFVLFPTKRIRNIFFTTIFLVISLILILYIPNLYSLIGYRVESVINYLLGFSVEEQSLNTRASFIENGWYYFLQRPWIGYGLDSFKSLPGSYGIYSHNNFIELLISGGIIGFVLYYLPYLTSTLKTTFNFKKANEINKVLFSIVVTLTILDYAVVSYYSRFNLIIFMLYLSTFESDTRKIKLV